jgi:hypothetical protein
MRALVALALVAMLAAPASRMADTSELSAARKRQTVKRIKPQPAPIYRWRPADPSFDQHGRPYRPPPGLSCPIDLGYGRWTSCNYR